MPLNAESFARIAPVVKSELQRLWSDDKTSAADALQQVFLQMFGPDRPRQEFIRFLFFASPIARRIAIGAARLNDPVGDTDIKVADLKLWLWWFDTMDPLCARMIDLHYFAGLSIKETAAALRMSPRGVIRDLRFAKSWLKAKDDPELILS
jgi:DNA-directed RNA polymerase specialized sigma24 family protein